MPDAVELTTQIVAAHLTKNPVKPAELPELIRSVHEALTKAGQPQAGAIVKEPAVPVKKSVFNDHIVCLECGKHFKTMKRHIEREHNLTTDEYRQRFALPRDYPMVAPAYAEARATIAKNIGLGHSRGGRKARRKRG